MRFTRNSIASKACVAGLTFATALAMVPTAAFAADLNGNTGNITINGLLDGDQVTAYQILKRHYDADTNNVTDTFMDGTGYTLEDFQKITSDDGAYVKGSDMQVAADKIASAIKGGASPISTLPTATAANGSVTFKDASAGEWLILVTGQDGTTRVYQNTIVSNAPVANSATGKYDPKDANATIKYTEETVHKGIGTTAKDAEDVTKKTADGLYGIGDLVPFVISTTVPNYPANSTQVKFVIGDTPSAGLAIQNDDTNPITVTVNGTKVDATDKVTGATNYTLEVSDAGVLTISFDKDYILKHTGESVLVNYKAKVTSDAKVTETDTTHNSATITFNTNPYESSESKPGDETEVKTYGLFFVKKGDNNPLKGATFQIKYKGGDKDGQPVLGDDGKPLSCTTKDDGIVWFEDLAAGTYTLVETNAPTGYQKVKDFEVTITKGANADNPATTDVKEANYVQHNATDGVPDPKVGMLPTTGDAGTIGLTAAGICLVAGSAFVIASRVRRSKDDQE